MTVEHFTNRIFIINSPKEFNALSMEIFRHQYLNNPVYQKFCDLLNRTPDTILSSKQIPFLPVSFFKTQKIITGHSIPEKIFKSSGTTANMTSSHYIIDLSLYEKSFINGFKHFFGDPSEYIFLALLPGYLERNNSSLVYMFQHLINTSNQYEDSGFYLNNYDALFKKLSVLSKQNNPKVILIGVSYALLKFSEKYSIDFPELIVMETGGMKGFRKELIREELHEQISRTFGVKKTYSEYGMTELLSQAFSKGDGLFSCPPWMQVSVRDPESPLTTYSSGSGALNITDLANLHSCSFIAVSDIGKIHNDYTFEILGRLDHSDIRGCNLLM